MKVTLVTIWIHLIAIAIVFATIGCTTSQIRLVKDNKENAEIFQLEATADMTIEEKVEAASTFCALDESPVFLDHAIVHQPKLDRMTLVAINELNKKINKSLKIAKISEAKKANTSIGLLSRKLVKKSKPKKMNLKIVQNNNIIVENSFKCLKISRL